MKTCSRCGETKARTEFNRDRSRGDGLQGRCRSCEAERNAAYHAANKERIAERDAQWREANRERIAEKKAAYYEANRDRLTEYRAEYYEANRHDLRWTTNAAWHIRRARAAGVLVDESLKDLEFVHLDAGYRCQLCGESYPLVVTGLHPLGPTVDHVVPLSYAGNDNPGHVRENLQSVHSKCNREKWNALPESFDDAA